MVLGVGLWSGWPVKRARGSPTYILMIYINIGILICIISLNKAKIIKHLQ